MYDVQSYLYLNKTNAELLNQIARLEKEVEFYKKTAGFVTDSTNRYDSIQIDSLTTLVYNYIPAHVVYNNIVGMENYIQLDKGSEDGIKPDMGVMSPSGIIGVVRNVSPHFSIVISVLNPKFQLNCKIKNENYFGPLVWDGRNFEYTYLENLPKHAEIEKGDTIVTSGFSAFFPEGLPVGVIMDSYQQKNDSYIAARIKLFADFSTLTNVLIIDNIYREEQIDLQSTIK